jgi:hypothetical protein
MPGISVQVIPSDSPHAGLLGAFVVAVTEQSPAIVYLENAYRQRFPYQDEGSGTAVDGTDRALTTWRKSS